MRNFEYIKTKKWHYIILLVLSLFFAGMGIFFEQRYYGTSQPEMDVSAFSNVLHAKESTVKETLAQLRNDVESVGIEMLYSNEHLYQLSEENDLSFLIYEGDSLLYWSNDIIDVYQVSRFPFKRGFMLRTNTTYCECIQLFSKKYRYVGLIKIKDCVYPKLYTKNNDYAKGFSLPGNVMIAEEGDKEVVPIYNMDGEPIFSLVQTPILHFDRWLYWSCILSWFVVLLLLFKLLRMFCSRYRLQMTQLRGFLPFTVLGFALLFLFSYVRIPEILYSGVLFTEGYYASSFAPSFGHLLLYTIYAFSCLVVAYRHVYAPAPLSQYEEGKRVPFAFGLQLFSSLIFFFVYRLTVNLIYNSKIDVAFVFVKNVSLETIASLFLISSWFFFWGLVNERIRRIYTDGMGLKQLILIRGGLALLWLIPLAIWGRHVDVFLYFAFFVIAYFIDIYKYYYKTTTFIYLTALVFLFLNLIISVCYWHSEINNDLKCFELAKRLNSGNRFMQDRSAEAVIRAKNPELLSDRTITQLMTDSISDQSARKIEYILRNHYFEKFWNVYDMSVQICGEMDEIEIRKGVYGDVVSCPTSILSDTTKFVRLGNTNFYMNKDERLSVCFIGDFLYDEYHLYVKFFPNIFYNRMSFIERISRSDASNTENLSSAKYFKNELLFVSGDYRYPNGISWIPETISTSAKFAQNGYDHYVCRFDEDSVVVVSKERMQSYAYILLLSYMFSAYILGALLVMLAFRVKNRKVGRSLLTRMQTLFVIPLLCSSVILGSISVYYFYWQYRNNQMAELGRTADSIQQSLQDHIGLIDQLSEMPEDDLRMMLHEISNLFRLDVILYDKRGVLYTSSLTSPDVVSVNKVGTMLMSPRARFSKSPSYYQIDSRMGVDCASYFVKAYNRKNAHIGYIDLLSSSAATRMKRDMMNNIVIVVDLYLVIMLLSIFVIWLINKKVTKPIVALSENFEQIKLTGENAKIDYAYDDEIGILVRQYNKMVDELMVNAGKLAKSEREFAWREMARRIAHEIKNPLTPMKLSVQMAIRKKELDPEGFDEYFKKTGAVWIEQIDNLSRIASEFSNFAKMTQGTVERIDLVEKLTSAVSLFENNMEEIDFELELNGIEHSYSLLDGKQLVQVFNNLFRNAIQSIPSDRKGKVLVSYREVDGMGLIAIQDNGCGIPDEIKDNLFLPNFTTKTSGMGLGLAIVKNIVNSANGFIWFESKWKEGTTFFLKFPLLAEV